MVKVPINHNEMTPADTLRLLRECLREYNDNCFPHDELKLVKK